MAETGVKILPRKFKYDSLLLDDIDSDATPEEVMAGYSDLYPALTGGHVEGPEVTEDALVYTFVTKIGTKGGAGMKRPDYALMQEISYALLQPDDEEPDLAPSEALEVI